MKYEVDDRGNVAQFYDEEGEIVATLDREAEVNGIQDQSTWDGGKDVTEWAVANGYPELVNFPNPDWLTNGRFNFSKFPKDHPDYDPTK